MIKKSYIISLAFLKGRLARKGKKMNAKDLRWSGRAGDTDNVELVGDALHRELGLGDEAFIKEFFGDATWQKLDKKLLAAGHTYISCDSGWVDMREVVDEDGEGELEYYIKASVDLFEACDFNEDDESEAVDWDFITNKTIDEDELDTIF